MEKTGEMDLYMYVDGRGRMTIPSALRCRTGMGKNSFVRARLYGSVVQLTHVTPREAAQMTEEKLLDFIRASERGGGKTGDAGAVGGSICRSAGCRGMLNGRQALLCVRVCC